MRSRHVAERRLTFVLLLCCHHGVILVAAAGSTASISSGIPGPRGRCACVRAALRIQSARYFLLLIPHAELQ